MNEQAEVRHRPEARRYELILSGQACARAEYQTEGDRVVFTHTVVDPSLAGRGLGSQLARGALEDVRRRGQRVVARCQFIADYIDRHEEWHDLLDSPA